MTDSPNSPSKRTWKEHLTFLLCGVKPEESQKKTSWLRRKIGKIFIRVVAQRGDPRRIAGGMAVGLFVGLLIPMTVQLIIAIPIALFFRLSAVAASVGTFITNPWSVIIIYPIQIYIGKWILTLHRPAWSDVTQICEDFMSAMGKISLTDLSSFNAFLNLGVQEIILPFFVAGALFGVIGAISGYYGTLSLVRTYRKKSNERKHKKRLARIEAYKQKES